MVFDKRMSWAVIIALVVQSAGALMWAGGAAERLDMLEADVMAARPTAERLARLEAELEAVRLQLIRIENKLDEVRE